MPQYRNIIYFKLVFSINEFYLKLDNNKPISFYYNCPHSIDVTLSYANNNEVKKIECIACCNFEPSPGILSIFKDLRQNRLPKDCINYAGDSKISTDSKIAENYVVPNQIMPQPFKDFSNQVYHELSIYTHNTINTIIWRTGLEIKHQPYSFVNFQWSFDNSEWIPMPHNILVFMDGYKSFKLSTEIYDFVLKNVQNLSNEPIAHELYREAWEQRYDRPRSALVLGIASAEIGLKNCIIMLLPETQWLLENLQSPSLVKMIKEYLPKLPAKCKIKNKNAFIPKDIIDSLEGGIRKRNQLVHVGNINIETDKLEQILLSINDFLWILDYYCGFEWALKYVRKDILEILKRQ